MEYLIQDSTLTSIANSIRAKTGSSAQIAVKNMVAQIDSIQTGGGGTAALDELISGATTEILGSNAVQIRASAFNGLTSLVTAEFLSVRIISEFAFYGCSNLQNLIIRTSDRLCTLNNTNAFYGSGLEAMRPGFIWVPDFLVARYQSETNWSNYASKIRPLSEYTG